MDKITLCYCTPNLHKLVCQVPLCVVEYLLVYLIVLKLKGKMDQLLKYIFLVYSEQITYYESSQTLNCSSVFRLRWAFMLSNFIYLGFAILLPLQLHERYQWDCNSH